MLFFLLQSLYPRDIGFFSSLATSFSSFILDFNLFLSIITFAIYHYFGSSFRLRKLSDKLKTKTKNYLSNQKNIFNLNKQCEEYENSIKQSQEDLQKIKSNVVVALQNNETEKTLKLQEIVPLSADFQIETNAGFIPLKDINGIEYKKL